MQLKVCVCVCVCVCSGLSMSDLFHMRQTHTLFRFRDFTLLSHAAKGVCVCVCVFWWNETT